MNFLLTQSFFFLSHSVSLSLSLSAPPPSPPFYAFTIRLLYEAQYYLPLGRKIKLPRYSYTERQKTKLTISTCLKIFQSQLKGYQKAVMWSNHNYNQLEMLRHQQRILCTHIQKKFKIYTPIVLLHRG